MEVSAKALEDYIALTSGDGVKLMCEDFFQRLGFSYFLYTKQFFNGQRLWLTTNGKWTEFFFKKGYYKLSAFENPQADYKPGYYLWSTLQGQEVFKDAREYFNIDHGITIVSLFSDGIEFIHLAAKRTDSHVLNCYTNNLDEINKFILKFRDQGKPLIELAQDNMLDISFKESVNKITKKDNKDKSLIKTIDPGVKKKMLSDHYNNVHLTHREVECIDWLKYGKTAEEIAMLLEISKRTAEVHIDNIKKKLNCYNMFQLGYVISKIDHHRV